MRSSLSVSQSLTAFARCTRRLSTSRKTFCLRPLIKAARKVMKRVASGLTEYFAFCSHERPHPSLGYRTPEAMYQSGAGGGAKIVDRFGEAVLQLGQHQTAAIEVGSTT
jgi:hypothetical protein